MFRIKKDRTRKNLGIAVSALRLTIGAKAQHKTEMNTSKKLVAYFSCTGTTKNAARKLAQAIGADIYEIQPAKPYTPADLNWNNKSSRSSLEMGNPSSRPDITGKAVPMAHYETVFIGFPIWWNLAPTLINTFIESYDLQDKTVVPFATSGGNGIGNSEKALRRSYPQIKWKSGELLNGRIDKNSLAGWMNQIE